MFFILPFPAPTGNPCNAPISVTWDTGSNNNGMTLSSGDLVAEENGNNLFGVMSSQPRECGKHYFEEYIEEENGAPGHDDMYTGICNNTVALAGFFTNGNYYVMWRDRGAIYFNGGLAHNSSSYNYTTGDTCCFAIDLDSTPKRAWLRKNGGSWIGGGDPAANTTPTGTFTLAGPDNFDYIVYLSDNGNAGRCAVRIKPNSAVFSFTPPTGFEPFSGS